MVLHSCVHIFSDTHTDTDYMDCAINIVVYLLFKCSTLYSLLLSIVSVVGESSVVFIVEGNALIYSRRCDSKQLFQDKKDVVLSFCQNNCLYKYGILPTI